MQKCSRVSHAALALIIVAMGGTGCTSDTPPPPPQPEERPNSENTPSVKLPITEVRQTLNIGYADLLRSVLATLGERKVPVNLVDESVGVIETGWVPTRDRLCNMVGSNQAPLPCRVRLLFKIDGISGISSALQVKYEEICTFNEDMRLECADSSAEKLLLLVLEDIKALDKTVRPGLSGPDGR